MMCLTLLPSDRRLRGSHALLLLIVSAAQLYSASTPQKASVELWTTSVTNPNGHILPGPMFCDLARQKPATKSGDRVMVIDNRSGEGHPALIQKDPERCATLQFVDGRPVLRFDGVDDYYVADVALDVANFDVVIRHRLTAPTDNPYACMVSGSDGTHNDWDENGFSFLTIDFQRSTAQNMMHLAHLRREGGNESMLVENQVLATGKRETIGQTRQICVGARLSPTPERPVAMEVEALAMASGLDAVSARRIGAELAVAPSRPRIVCAGDSITDGSLGDSGVWPTQEYPCFVAAERPEYLVINSGSWGCQIAGLFSVDEYLVPGSWLVVFIGSNDCTGRREPKDIYGDIAAYCRARKAKGWKVIVCTLLPRDFDSPNSGDGNDFEQRRTTVNDLLRKNYRSFADELVDLGLDKRIGTKGAERNTEYYQPDTVHLEVGGTRVVAELVLKGLPKGKAKANADAR